MHICFIEDTTLHGGTQIWVSEAMRVFLAAGHEVTLLTAADGFNATDAAELDVRVVTYDYDAVTRQDRRHQDIWTDALASTDVAVCTVHPPRDGFHCSMFAAHCISEAQLDTVLMPKSGTIVPDYRAEFYAPSDARTHVIAITDFTRHYIVDTYEVPVDRVSLVYQGTDVATFTPDPDRSATAAAKYPLPESAGPIIGCVGSFEDRKGQVMLLDAVARVRDELPGVHVMLVGDGPDEQMLREHVADNGLGQHVTFFPFTTEPVDVFEVIDILALPSTYKEGLPNVILEAMAMALPVVSSRLAGTPEVVIDDVTGILVEPGDVDALAAAIVRLGTDTDLCSQMGAAGQRLMRADFDKRRQFDAFAQLFADVTSARR